MNLPEHVKQAALAAVIPPTRDDYIDRSLDWNVDNDPRKFSKEDAVALKKKLGDVTKEISRDKKYLELEEARYQEEKNTPVEPGQYYAKMGPKAIELRDFVKKTLAEKGIAETDQSLVIRALNYSGEMIRPWPGTEKTSEKKKDGIER